MYVAAGKLSRHGSRFNSTNQLAAAFGFNPYGSQTGSTGVLAQRGKDKESWWQKTLSLRNTSIALDDILQVPRGRGGCLAVGWFTSYCRNDNGGWWQTMLLLTKTSIALDDILQV